MDGLLSVVIPSREEKYLKKTIQDILSKANQDIEIIAILDGGWSAIEEFVDDERVKYIHYKQSRGMRNAINSGVAISRGEYLLKCDAHCMFAKGFDEILKADCAYDWVVVPRRFALDPENWVIKENPKYPIDYMFLNSELHGEVWTDKNKDPDLKDNLIDDLMSSQGSCWMMKKDYFEDLELLDEANYGQFWQEFQEIGLKCWLSGGRVVVNKKTWYAHWHKESSRGYSLKEKDPEFVQKWISKKVWHKQIHDLDWLINKFAPVPTWTLPNQEPKQN